jgi:hypothetical protein
MAWDEDTRQLITLAQLNNDTHRVINLARLKLSPPYVVYEALEAYGANASSGRFTRDTDEELELSLEQRGDPLIDLGLSRNASCRELLQRLYSRALAGTGNSQHDLAIRLACLGNRVAPGMLFAWRPAGVAEDELRRIALHGEFDEFKVLMQNPASGGVLRDVYARKAPFEDIPDERWMTLVQASTGNPRLNVDDSNQDGPDMLAWDIHNGVFLMLQQAPTTAQWLRTLYYLLIDLNKDAVKIPASGELDAVLSRWAGVRVPKLFGKDEAEDGEGWYTELTFAAEFRCLVAALYGRSLDNKSFVVQGGLDDEEIAKRCAFYGNGELTPKTVESAYEKDGNAFSFAALLNDSALLDKCTRAALEPLMRGELLRLYEARCKQLARKWRWFNPKPVSQDLEEVLDMSRERDGPVGGPHAEAVANLTREVADLKAQIQQGVSGRLRSLLSLTLWGLIGLAALIWFRH